MSYVINMPSAFVDVTSEEMTYDGGSFWSFLGGICSIIGGICTIIGGALLFCVPEPTTASKVGGYVGIAAGVAAIGAGACAIADSV